MFRMKELFSSALAVPWRRQTARILPLMRQRLTAVTLRERLMLGEEIPRRPS